jgi:hypothetical protein
MSTPLHYRAIIVSFRHKGSGISGRDLDLEALNTDPDVSHLKALLSDLKEKYGQALTVVGLGADRNFGLLVRMLCEQMQIGFAEYLVLFNKCVPKHRYFDFFFARHAALMDLALTPGEAEVYYHVYINKSRLSDIEDLVTRLKESTLPYRIYSESNEVLEAREHALG